MVNIEGLNKADVLRVLYNNAKPLGFGLLHFIHEDMSKEDAEEIIEHCKNDNYFYFDYLRGRVMKIDLKSDIEFDERFYDRDNGQGAAQEAINKLKHK